MPTDNMIIHAASLGSPVFPMNFHAEVHSVYNQVVNLSLHESDTIVSLLFRDDNDQPGDVRLDRRHRSLMDHFSPGGKVSCQEGEFTLPHSPIRIRLKDANRVDCGVPDPCQADHSTIEEASRVIQQTRWQKTCDLPANGGIQQLLSTKIDHGLDGVRQLLLIGDENRLIENVSQLVGLGFGLTPTGDDILIGLMAGLQINKVMNTINQERSNAINSAVLKCRGKTNQISRKYLQFAAAGYYSAYLIDLLKAVCSAGTLGDVKGAAEKVASTGHTSGTDTLLGFLAALDLLKN